jgi:ATP-dependent helicase HepA
MGDDIKPGQVVFLKSKPEIKGAVVSVTSGEPENRYNVFIDGKIQILYASQIQAEKYNDEKFSLLSYKKFQAYLTSLQIQNPELSKLYSLNAARVDYIPYQFRPVLKFIKSDRPRLLIADDVGVGKTIEAGLILRELQSRRDIQSVLIICPRPLITEGKWRSEMRRFDEHFEHLDGKNLKYCINEMDLEGVWPERYKKVIVPYSLFDETLLYGTNSDKKNRKHAKGLLDLDPPPQFDLVIVDEAHHIRNQNTYTHKAVRFFCDHSEAVVFLTATPIQLGSNDLFVLLNTLRPDLIIDKESFAIMAEPNPFINKAISYARSGQPKWNREALNLLVDAGNTAWGKSILSHNPKFIQIKSTLSKDNIEDKKRIQIINDLEKIHTFSGIINRTRRRDIGDFTIRKPETVRIPFTPSQQEFYDELIDIQTEIFKQLHGDKNIKFMMTTIRRQAASCLYGLIPFLKDILNRHIDELPTDEYYNNSLSIMDSFSDSIKSQIHSIIEKAKSIDPEDPKLDKMIDIIHDKQKLPNNKIMIFSSFKHTLNYIYQHLKKKGYRIGMIHGDVPDDERDNLSSRFRLNRDDKDALDIMLFSEVGSEGLDYQFCDCIINYDLPWNPMRIEQRIGRIDRWGQKSESVAIFNLVTPGTVDADIYERCLLRIGVFNHALGGSEEILGEITKEIKNIAESFTLDASERRKKLQQLSDNKIRLIKEQETLEEKQIEFFGLSVPQKQLNKEIREASSFWLSPKALYNLVMAYIQEICNKVQDFILGEKALKTLRLPQECRSLLLDDFRKLQRQRISPYREWEKWLKGNNQHLSITFDSQCATQHRDASFIMPLHPLVKQASKYFEKTGMVAAMLKAKDSSIPGGKYPFAIYQWQFYGIKNDIKMCSVSTSEVITSRLDQLLENAEENTGNIKNFLTSSTKEELDICHYNLWIKAKEKYIQQTRDQAKYMLESLGVSHKARIALLSEQLNRSTNDKIRRMHQAQIDAAEEDYNRRVRELNNAAKMADITAQPVAYGVLQVEGENGNE